MVHLFMDKYFNLMDHLDYSQALLRFQGTRRHFFRDKLYHITVFNQFFVMGETPTTNRPKYRIVLDLETKISWELLKQGKDLMLIAFIFPYGHKVRKIMHASPQDLIEFKRLIQSKVTFDGIGDLYLPLNQIGKGSSAKVYSAQSVLDKQVYAIKAIEKTFLKQTENGQGMLAFQSEVRILQHLAHNPDCFLSLKEIYEGDNTFYLVTSYLEGASLNEEIDRSKSTSEGRLPILAIKQLMKKLLADLAVLHDFGIIHRDVKPDNLMFARKNDFSSLVLVDFGLATHESNERFLFPKCGTPGFVAPEILTSRVDYKYTCKVDLFSAGCILYKLLTGMSLFTGQSFDEVLKNNKRCILDFPKPNEAGHLTEHSLNLLKLLLNKNPKLRISAAAAVQHPFFNDMVDISTQIQIGTAVQLNTPRQQGLINLQKIQEFGEQGSFYDINDEVSDDEDRVHKIPNMKRCSLLSEITSPPAKSVRQGTHTTFFHKEPLSTLKSHKIRFQSPLQKQS